MSEPQNDLGYELVVVHAFADYQRGNPITDPETITEILKSECAPYVNKVAPSSSK
jgi:hypothetical protein